MSPLYLYGLVLLSAVAHAAWNALVKGAGDRLLMMAAIRFVGLTFGLATLPFVPWPEPQAWPWLAATVFSLFVYHALLIQSYRLGDMSLVYPIARGAAPLLLALIAFVAIDERLSEPQMAAVLLTSIGILALVIGRRENWAAVGCAGATSLSIATYSFLSGSGVRNGATLLGFQAWLEILLGVGVLGFVAVRRRAHIVPFVRQNGTTGVLAGALSVAGFLAYLAAAKVLPLAPVVALRESSVIFGTVVGSIAFKEAFGLRRIAAATLVACGIVSLALTGQH
jgi:drug/metabolite transporter (DMT)-like permease